MPHRIDIDGIRRNIFVLMNLAYASEPFCADARVNRVYDERISFGWSYYIGWLKSTVCEILIETAIKIRILKDMLNHEQLKQIDFDDLGKRSLRGMSVGHFNPSMDPMSIRDACNKIIHAEEVMLTWINGEKNDEPFEFWNGDLQMQGHEQKTFWECKLYVVNFCIVLENLLVLLDEEVDWNEFYRFDE